MVYTGTSICMEGGGEVVQPVWTMCLHKIVSSFACEESEREEEKNEHVKTLFNKFQSIELRY